MKFDCKLFTILIFLSLVVYIITTTSKTATAASMHLFNKNTMLAKVTTNTESLSFFEAYHQFSQDTKNSTEKNITAKDCSKATPNILIYDINDPNVYLYDWLTIASEDFTN